MADWAKLKVVDLKAELKRRDLPQHGLKAELVARLVEADQSEAAPEASNEEEEKDGQGAQGDSSEGLGKDGAETPDGTASSDTISVQAPPEIKPSSEKDVEVRDFEPENKNTEDLKGSVLSEELPQTSPEPSTEARAPSADKEMPDALSQEPSNNSEEKPAENLQDEIIVTSETGREPTETLSNDPPPTEAESQKRKRRSATPTPDAEAVAKRARTLQSEMINTSTGAAISKQAQPETQAEEATGDSMEGVQTQNKLGQPIGGSTGNKAGSERDVPPSVHPATTALYISNLMRPLRPVDIQTHLADLATPAGQPPNDDIITEFHIDQVRSHAFVVFDNLPAASRVRNLLHDCVWPNESNRKALWVDFIPPEKVPAWIEKESGQGGRSANNIPVGPRSQRDLSISNAPTGPRSKRSGPGPRPPPGHMAGGMFDAKRTQAQPVIGYTPVSEDLARRRLDNMRSFYKRDVDRRDLGRDFNRYSFEDGDGFVDRGKEDLVEEGLAEEGLEDEEEDRPHTEEAGIDTSPVVLVVVTTALLVAITDRRIARHRHIDGRRRKYRLLSSIFFQLHLHTPRYGKELVNTCQGTSEKGSAILTWAFNGKGGMTRDKWSYSVILQSHVVFNDHEWAKVLWD
uniref:SAP domain-containing protein n=1 Tax=Bionectria ochroleuca TaxID=29856 RepID=A0A0B7JT72_BIOOC